MNSNSITSIRNSGNMSRIQVVAWVNSRVGRSAYIERVEDLCTGLAYCRLTQLMSPQSIDMSQVNMRPVGTLAFEHNLGLVQEAFKHMEVKKKMPIDLLIQGRFKHNFEFFTFFKKLYDSYTEPPVERKVSKPFFKPKTALDVGEAENKSKPLAKVEAPKKPKTSLAKGGAIKKEAHPAPEPESEEDPDY